MADLPILFSAPMVRALMREIEAPGTGKTQTRRVMNPQPHERAKGCYHRPDGSWVWVDAHRENNGAGYYGTCLDDRHFFPRYATGDRLYVREHWRAEYRFNDRAPRDIPPGEAVQYIADDPLSPWDSRFRQGMHMPRWASRITLLVTDVRVARLQDCSEADARAEGVRADASITDAHNHWVDLGSGDLITGWDAREVYASLWNHINGPGAWAANPWVAAYTFRPILGNIDQIGAAQHG